MIEALIAGFTGLWRRQPVSVQPPPAPPRGYRIRSIDDLMAMDEGMRRDWLRETFKPAEPLPGVLPDGVSFKDYPALAMDDAGSLMNAVYGYLQAGMFAGGVAWLGYPYLSELLQITEFRLISEVRAQEMTRKWVKFKAKSKNKEKGDRIGELTKFVNEKYKLRKMFRRALELDGGFGIGHIYIDLRDGPNGPLVWEDREKLKSPLVLDKRTIKKGSLRGFIPVEPMWTYPATYNADNPLRDDFYHPRSWYVMGYDVHSTRLLSFVSHEMPDLLKAAYSFGGMSLTQMSKPAVDYFLSNRGSVGQLVGNFATPVLKTDMSAALMGGGMDFILKRGELYNRVRNNNGLFMLNKKSGADDGEDFAIQAVPLTSLPELQQQSAEHMAFPSRQPLVKLLGVTPAGLNATSDGEIRTYYDTISAEQEDAPTEHLMTCMRAIMLSEWGEIDEDIVPEWLPLWQLDEAGKAAVRKIEADVDEQYVNMGAIAPETVRARLAQAEDTQYQGLNLDEEPDPMDIPGSGKGEIDDPEVNRIERESVGAGGGGAHGAASGV